MSDVTHELASPAQAFEAPSSAAPVIRLARARAPMRDRFRAYRVLVDGALVGTVRNGRVADFVVPTGRHQIRLQLDWLTSNPIDVDLGAGQMATFDCGPAGSSVTAFFDGVACLINRNRPWIWLRPSHEDLGPALVDGRSEVRIDPYAVASLVLGILWGLGFTSILAVLFGHLARHRIARSDGRELGRGLALSGIVLGWIGIIGMVLLVAFNWDTGSALKSTTQPPASPTPLNVQAAGLAYQNAINPVNSAVQTFATEAGQWNNRTTDAQMEHDAQPVITTLQQFHQALDTTAWPASATPQVRSLVASVPPLISTLRALGSLRSSRVSTWETTFERDVGGVRSADDQVRQALGLPLLSGGATGSSGSSGSSGSTGGGSAGSPNVSPAPGGSTGTATTGSLSGGRTSVPTSGGRTSSSQPARTQGGGGGAAGGGGSCLGCVTITTVNWGFYAAPGSVFSGDYANCVPGNTSGPGSEVIGPDQTDPNRTFTVSVRFEAGCTLSDGTLVPNSYAVGQVSLQNGSPPISVVGTDPTVPFNAAPGVWQTLTVTLHVPDGNFYDGPLSVSVIFD